MNFRNKGYLLVREEGDTILEFRTNLVGQNLRLVHQEGVARNERFVAECLRKIRSAPDEEEGLRSLLRLGGGIPEM